MIFTVSIFIRTIIIYVLLTFSLKIMGKRQVGELEVGELVSTLLVSEIVSIPIDTPEIPLVNAVIPLIFIISTEIILSYFKNRSRRLKKIVEGTPTFIIFSGKLNEAALSDNRISIDEVITEMHIQGISDIGGVEHCILEASGKLSFFEKDKGELTLPLVVDGVIREENLKLLGVDGEWVQRKLRRGGKVKDVFLMTAGASLTPNIIYKDRKNETRE